MKDFPRHGGPQDRGSADRYYNRRYRPHYYEKHTGGSPRIEKENMTVEQILEYTKGYNEEIECKDYGVVEEGEE